MGKKTSFHYKPLGLKPSQGTPNTYRGSEALASPLNTYESNTKPVKPSIDDLTGLSYMTGVKPSYNGFMLKTPDLYASPSTPVETIANSYGSPEAPVKSPDSYGSPAGPVKSSDSYGIPE